MKAMIVISSWKGNTWAPALNPSLAKKICSAQKVENMSTLNAGDVEEGFMVFSCDIYFVLLAQEGDCID